MALLAAHSVILAAEGFADEAVPAAIARAYDGRVIWLDSAQKLAFAGNAITLSPERVWMSTRAYESLHEAQRAALQRRGFSVGTVALDGIEAAGGSLRCCVGEFY